MAAGKEDIDAVEPVSNAAGMGRIDISDFRARCLAILDRVHETGERVVIPKRGRPVAEPSRPTEEESRYPQAELEGTAVILGDVMEAVFPEEHRVSPRK